MTQPTAANESSPRHPVPVLIELFALDTEHCSPCRSAVSDVEEAAAELVGSLDGSTYSVATRVVQLTGAEEARRLGILSSPTVRVNGRDVAVAVQEQQCPSCSDLANAPTLCRSYVWKAERYDHPPVGLIVEAVRRHLDESSREFHPYLGEVWTRPAATSVDRFFAARAAHR